MSRTPPFNRSTVANIVISKCLFAAQAAMCLKILQTLGAFQVGAFQSNAFQVGDANSVNSDLRLEYGSLFRVYRLLTQQNLTNSYPGRTDAIEQATAIIEQLNTSLQLIVPTPDIAASLANLQVVVANGLDEMRRIPV